jgi:CDGSH-type Zn-finger protein
MSTPTIAAKNPIPVELEAGKTYAWCSCGESSKQPFCDGSHKGGDFTPTMFKAEESKTAYMCQCKHAKDGIFCDGSHKAL